MKRAKAIVMQKAYYATKGQYEVLYDYQLELLRSNPGSTVVINKLPDVDPPTFWRMYVCFDACKKGFLAECRKVSRHIYANWKKEFFKKEWQKLFWACAKAPCPMLFNLVRARLAKETRPGTQAILNTHPQHWSRAWFRLGSNCDSVDNNLCESFNKWIVEARFFPIITMLEAIRRKVMTRIQEQRSKSERLMG